jgi:hypothetical protein
VVAVDIHDVKPFSKPGLTMMPVEGDMLGVKATGVGGLDGVNAGIVEGLFVVGDKVGVVTLGAYVREIGSDGVCDGVDVTPGIADRLMSSNNVYEASCRAPSSWLTSGLPPRLYSPESMMRMSHRSWSSSM